MKVLIPHDVACAIAGKLLEENGYVLMVSEPYGVRVEFHDEEVEQFVMDYLSDLQFRKDLET